MVSTSCPFCENEFPVELDWDSGKCPHCGEEYYWEEYFTEDYSDSWATIYWQRWDEKHD